MVAADWLIARNLTSHEACRFCATRAQGSQLGTRAQGSQLGSLEPNQCSKVVGAFAVECGEARRARAGEVIT